MADEDTVEDAEELPNASTEEGVRKQRLTAKLRQQQEDINAVLKEIGSLRVQCERLLEKRTGGIPE